MAGFCLSVWLLDASSRKDCLLNNLYNGLVVKEQSGFFWVEVADGTVWMCRLRGRLMEEAQSSDIAAIGDRVKISTVENDESGDVGVIEEVQPRKTTLSRAVRTSGNRGRGDAEREHVIVANPDAIFMVFAAAEPTPDLLMLDRFLVAGERAEIDDIVIVVNKIDLEDPTNIQTRFAPYEQMGYPVLYTSAKDQQGIQAIRNHINGKLSAFTGPSGVGKSTLLNLIQPGLARQVKSVSKNTQEGIHTTRDSALIKLSDGQFGAGTYLADTPGIRQLSIYDMEPEELDAYFLDIAEYVNQCRFGDCSHVNEPGCAVRDAAEARHISRRRYKSYRKLRVELEDALAALYG